VSAERRRHQLAGVAGTVPGLLLFTWMVTGGTWSLLGWHRSSDFYDVQAHRLLGGHLDMPASTLGIEAFASRGRTYMYQGPFPSLLRLPVVAFTTSLDGRLSNVSMLLAFVVVAACVTALTWQLRRSVGGDAPATRWQLAAIGGFVFVATGGSVLVPLASQASVYYESALWGIATGLVALVLLVEHLRSPRRWTLAATSLAAAACVWSRASIGVGAAGAIGFVFVGEAAAWWRQRRGQPEWSLTSAMRPARAARPAAVVAALLACLAPIALYAGLNIAKFGSAISVPWGQQAFTSASADRRQFLRENDGTYFGLQFVPSTAVAYLRPDAVAVERRFPWIGFRTADIGRRRLVRGALFDKVDATGSIPVNSPFLGVLGIVGLAAVWRERRLRVALAPLLGAAAAAATIFVFGYIALRYLGDAYPLVAVAGCAGIVALTAQARAWGANRRRAVVAGLVALGLLSTWVNLGQAVSYQRVFASPGDERATAALVRWQHAAPPVPGVGEAPLRRGDHLPARGRAGDLFVVGACDGLYVSDGATVDELSHTNWKPVVRTSRLGAFDVDVRFPRAPVGTVDPLLASGTPGDASLVDVSYLAGNRIRIGFRGAGIGGGAPVHVTPGHTYRMRLSMDPETDLSTVVLGDRTVFSGIYDGPAGAVLGQNDLDGSTRSRFGGTLRQRPTSQALCREVAGA
jgi:hypothetical protein